MTRRGHVCHLASSRLKIEFFDIPIKIERLKWFINGRRSHFFLWILSEYYRIVLKIKWKRFQSDSLSGLEAAFK